MYAVLTLSVIAFPATAPRRIAKELLDPAVFFAIQKPTRLPLPLKMDAGTMQKYKIEWFIGGKSMWDQL